MGLIDQTMAPAAAPVYTINGMDGKPMQVTDDQLAAMDHATLYALRDRNQGNQATQAVLGPYEHRAFARQATDENPLMSVPIALATPLYSAAKSVGLMTDGNTSKPSLREVGQGLLGVGEGLAKAFRTASAQPP